MVNKPGWLADSVARADGYYSPKGEKLKGEMLTPEQVAEWNGEAAPVAEEPKVEMILEAPVDMENLEDMSKRELEQVGRAHGIELDRREKKSSLIDQLKEVMD
tara:strand:- start:10745 stop:11053 length:309 start_codon:yes stop_codon:yes gene_type:complete